MGLFFIQAMVIRIDNNKGRVINLYERVKVFDDEVIEIFTTDQFVRFDCRLYDSSIDVRFECS